MKFAHIADTHIRNLKYHDEYRTVFNKEYPSSIWDSIEKMKKANQLFSSVDVEGAGHEVTTDKPHEFIAATRDFLSL